VDRENFLRRYELKYILGAREYLAVMDGIKRHTVPDEFPESSIMNIYYDTADFRLVRKSIEKPFYKEKLRLRSYGVLDEGGECYIEIKKKYNSVVYKRREGLPYGEMKSFLLDIKPYSLVTEEIAYMFRLYEGLSPRMFITYSRKSFKGVKEKDLRITFDSDILWRDYDLSLSKGAYGERVMTEGSYLMEIKTSSAVPLWLSEILTREKVVKTSFSKYGNAYLCLMKNKKYGDLLYA